MTKESGAIENSMSKGDPGVRRRGLLRFGTVISAMTGAFAVSALGASDASAAPGDKNSPNTYIPIAEKGTAAGVATLDGAAKVLANQLPDLSGTYGLRPDNGRRTVGKDELVLNATDYGIIGNGTNEGAAINAFLLIAAGKRAYFPPGNYATSQVLLPKSNTTIFGAGRSVTVFTMLGNDTSQNTRINIAAEQNATLRDFTITEANVLRRIGNYGLISGAGLKRCLIENVECTVSSGTGMHFMYADELIVKDCFVHHTKADGIHIQRGSKNIILTNNVVNNNEDDAIGFVSHAQSTAGYCSNIVISGNILGPTSPGAIGSGIALIGCLGATIVGNTIMKAASAGIRITSIDERPKNTGFAIVGNILVDGNRIIECGWYSGTILGQTRDGVAIYNSRNVTVRGNVIDRPRSNGVIVSQCSVDAVIESNDIRRPGSSAIFVAQAEQSGDYLALWTHPDLDDGRVKPYVAHHNLSIVGNRINSAGMSGIIAQGTGGRYIDGLTCHRNKIRFTNTTASAGQYGISISYIDDLDLTQNDVGDAASGATITRYNKSNIINAVVSGNRPLASTTGQATFLGQHQHTSGPVDPSSGTWEVGQVIWNNNPQAGTPAFRECTIAGTLGLLNGGGTTGSITSGTTSLVVNSVLGLGSGGYITIAGVSGKKKITGVQGTTLTLSSPSDATVSGASVAFSPASFRSPSGLA